MIWKNGWTDDVKLYRWQIKRDKKEEWHRWFAWHPVVVGITKDKHKIKAWLRFVLRKGTYNTDWFDHGWIWGYNLVDQDEFVDGVTR